MAGSRISGQDSVLLDSSTTRVQELPMIWGETQSQDLKDLKLQGGTLLQYVDDLLITRTSFQQCLISSMVLIIIIIIIIIIILIIANTISTTLKCFASCGYKVSAQKAQICQQAVRFLGFLLEPGKRSLIGNRRGTTIQIRVPNTRKEFRGFQGMVGYCCSWIPNLGLIAEPLYEALKGPDIAL